MIPVKEIKTTIPGYRPILEERETIITFNETQEPAEVFTHNPAMIRKLDALTDQRPEEVTCCRAETINGVELREYRVPKKWVKVNASRILSEDQKQAIRERFRINSDLKNAL